MSDFEELEPSRAGVERALGRRLRPWWGMAPWKLAIRGVVQAAIFGLLAYGCWLVRSGEVDLEGTPLADRHEAIELVATIGLLLAAVGIAYSLLRVVIGIIDLTPRRRVEGVVLQARRRRSGDFLPGPAQHLYYRRQRRDGTTREHRRRTRLEVVLDTPDGPKSWNVRGRTFSQLQPGARVRLAASPLLGYVSSVETLTPAQSPTRPGNPIDRFGGSA